MRVLRVSVQRLNKLQCIVKVEAGQFQHNQGLIHASRIGRLTWTASLPRLEEVMVLLLKLCYILVARLDIQIHVIGLSKHNL